ncbi:MAG: site-2 protease family protein [Planctomycetota bacterium]
MSKLKDFLSKYYRILSLVAVLVVLIFLIARNINAFGNVLLVLLGFGAVIIVHEFGHFVLAKAGGIKVEAFSLFMPPILLGVQKTERGIRFRILPEIFPKEKEAREGKEGDESDEGALSFTVRCKVNPGETEYRIGLIPFGGFVKMLGQEDTGSVRSNSDPRSYANKPVSTRAAVLAAGVTFNVISAIIIFMIVFLIGIQLPPAMVGGVMPNSPAARAGLKAGDEIIAIGGEKDDLDFSNIALAAALSGRDEQVPMTVRHEDGSQEEMTLVAEQLPGEPMRGFGVLAAQTLTVAKLSKADAAVLSEETGLKPGDRIEAIAGQSAANHWDLIRIVEGSLTPQVTLSVERVGNKGQAEQIDLQFPLNLRHAEAGDIESESELANICSMVPRLRITAVSARMNSTGDDAGDGLKVGDVVLAIGNVENPTYKEMRDITAEHEDKELSVKVLRTEGEGGEQVRTVTVVPERQSEADRVVIGVGVALDAEHAIVAKTLSDGGRAAPAIPRGAAITAVDGVAVSSFYDVIRELRRYGGERITIDWRLDEQVAGNIAVDLRAGGAVINAKSEFAGIVDLVPFQRLQKTYKAGGPVDAISMGYRKTVMFIAQTYVTLKRLFGGLVSPKNLTGPVGIIKLSYDIVARQPLIYYIYFLGLINAVIAVFNFLPLPPLDGGLVVLLLVEKLKGAALSERVQTIVAYTGWTLIGTLILYVTYNDIAGIVRGFLERGV